MNVSGSQSSSVNILLNVQANQSNIQQAQAAMNNASAAIDKVTKSALSLKTAGRDLREVGGVIAASGAAMLAPFIAAANTYEQQYKGLETSANNYAAAQRRQQDATVSLGRSAAQALTPFLNDVANVEQKIADFAAAHPDIVQAVVGGGAVLATAGAGLAAVGQALVTVANAAKLLGVQIGSIGELLSALGQAVGAGVVIWAGVNLAIPATIKALNLLGDATNDQRLKTLTLTDVMNTGAQAIQIAAKLISDTFIGVNTAAKIAQLALQHINDPSYFVANKTPIIPVSKADMDAKIDQMYKLAQAQTSGYEQPRPGLLKMGTGYYDPKTGKTIPYGTPPPGTPGTTVQGPVAPNVYVPQNPPIGAMQDKALQDMIAGLPVEDRSKIHSVADLKAYYESRPAEYQAQFPTPQSISQVPQSQFDLDKAKLMAQGSAQMGVGGNSIVNGVVATGVSVAQNAVSSFSGGQSSDISASVNAFIAYQKQIKQSDIQYGQERLRITTDYNNQTLQTEKDRAAEGLQIARDRAAEEAKLESDQAAAKVKAAADFAESEKQTDERIAFEKKQRLYQQALDARNLAAEGDVSGFIAQQQQNIIQNTLQDQQNAFDKQQRQEQFDYQQKQQDIADQRARDQQKAQYKLEDQDRAAQYQKEDQDRVTAYQNQLTALQTSHDNQLAEMQSAFAQQLADLQDNVGGLHDIQNAYYTQATSDLNTFIGQNETAWQQMYKNILANASTNAPFIQPPTLTPPPPSGTGGGMFGFAKGGTLTPGWNMVGENGPEWIHGGSRSVVPMEGVSRGGGRGGISISIGDITLNGGSGANGGITKADLQKIGTDLYDRIENQLVLAMGASY